ncbi:Cu(2+)-transporting P-type ATPase, partial [Coemansia sp. RSA 1933]
MTCQSCVKSVTAALKATPGIIDAVVELEPKGKATVTIATSAIDVSGVLAAIEDAGFEATLGQDDGSIAHQASTSSATLAVAGQKSVKSTPESSAGVLSPLLPEGKGERKARGRGLSTGSGPTRTSSSGKSGETLLDPGETIQIEVRGMTCSSCVGMVERTVGSRDGVQNISVSLLAQRATVHYDSSMVSQATIVQAISDLGFEAKALDGGAQRVAKISLNIYGMTCASCVSLVERAVAKEAGVVSVSVSLALETATIEYRPSEIGVRRL